MKFTKMHGCGNDYIYINCFEETIRDPSKMALRLSDRHYGIGGDGLILIEPSKAADAYMHMFNRDGSEGMMCGNGIRCTAKYIYDHGLVPAERENVLILLDQLGKRFQRAKILMESGIIHGFQLLCGIQWMFLPSR